ncbi:hypothetical protein DDE05_21560 [Streptomyces cavourensis]|jgi:hypothetical protein|uniref:hypothetical protein n=1 Tax=Achromobacter sp. DH1f TaxID=1397275 RepID=UPI00046932C2|nr:hypothetical protein [Achromobacter sp. DH1f]RBL84796.1 hypothetical protein DDE05_21560 [Streptomyces cavourensis]
MKKSLPLLLGVSVLLTACGPNKIIVDLPSPDGKYHVEVRKCPQAGSLTWTEKTQVSILDRGVSEACQSAVKSLAQFDAPTPEDQLQLEWLSDTELRAWHPSFNPEYGPQSANFKPGTPIKLVYAPKK